MRPPGNDQAGEHVPLELEHITLWAKFVVRFLPLFDSTQHCQHDGQADKDFITPPNCLNFDRLVSRTRPSRTARRSQPEIHVHLDREALTGTPAVSEPVGVKQCHDELLYNSDSDSGDEPITIDNALAALHGKLPEHNFPQYTSSLKAHGIRYAENVADFPRTFFIETIKMEEGAVGTFLKRIGKLIHKQKRTAKKVRVAGKENVHPQASDE